nr:probable E3 ubiquitin-protein ligase RZFP34 [Ipomoea batatas]
MFLVIKWNVYVVRLFLSLAWPLVSAFSLICMDSAFPSLLLTLVLLSRDGIIVRTSVQSQSCRSYAHFVVLNKRGKSGEEDEIGQIFQQGFRGVPQNHQSRNPPSSRSWQPELAHRSFPPAPFMEIHRSEPKPVSDMNQKLTLRRITASRQSFATAPVATLALDALPCWKEQRSPEEKTEVQGAGRRSVRLALQICFCSTGFADWFSKFASVVVYAWGGTLSGIEFASCLDMTGPVGQENFFHCSKCSECPIGVGVATPGHVLKNSHPCVEGAMHDDCPICFEKLKKSLEGYAVRFLKPSVPIAIEAGFELTSVAASPGFIPFSKTELRESSSELELEQDSCDPEFPESGEQERISPNESSYNGESPLINKRSEPLFSKSGGLVWAQTVSKEPKCI